MEVLRTVLSLDKKKFLYWADFVRGEVRAILARKGLKMEFASEAIIVL